MRLGTANQSALLQHSLALLTSNLFMTLAPGQTFIRCKRLLIRVGQSKANIVSPTSVHQHFDIFYKS